MTRSKARDQFQDDAAYFGVGTRVSCNEAFGETSPDVRGTRGAGAAEAGIFQVRARLDWVPGFTLRAQLDRFRTDVKFLPYINLQFAHIYFVLTY